MILQYRWYALEVKRWVSTRLPVRIDVMLSRGNLLVLLQFIQHHLHLNSYYSGTVRHPVLNVYLAFVLQACAMRLKDIRSILFHRFVREDLRTRIRLYRARLTADFVLP